MLEHLGKLPHGYVIMFSKVWVARSCESTEPGFSVHKSSQDGLCLRQDLFGMAGPLLGIRIAQLKPGNKPDESQLEQERHQDQDQALLSHRQAHAHALTPCCQWTK